MSNIAPAKHSPYLPSHPVADALARLYLAILALLPFHAFLTTWVGSNAGHLDLWRIWKEVLIFASSLVVFWLLAINSQLRRQVLRGWLGWLVTAYVLWGLMVGVLALYAGTVSGDALVYGLFVDLRFVAFMMLVMVVAGLSPRLSHGWRRVLMGPLVIVVAFGLLQLALPADFLRHFGYGPDTIPAVQFVDNKPEYPRVQSTLRGANPLGAYLVVGVAVVVSLGIATRRKWYWLVLAGCLVALGFTYSRSAYLGALMAAGGTVWLLVVGKHWQKRLVMLGAVVMTVGIVGVVALRNNDVIQNIAFHSDEHSASTESSNAGRARSLVNGAQEVLRSPLGRGVGTAGPASVRNTKQPARIAENYYIQVAQEMGWIGLGLFIAIQVGVLRRLWPHRTTPLAAALLASWCGLLVVNMLSHAWADDTLGLLWWGLAGIALSATMPDNQKDKRKHTVKHLHGQA